MIKDSLEILRKYHGLTQTEVAKRIGVSPSTYNRYESGKCTPDIFKLKQLADLFNVSIADILEGFDNFGMAFKDKNAFFESYMNSLYVYSVEKEEEKKKKKEEKENKKENGKN